MIVDPPRPALAPRPIDSQPPSPQQSPTGSTYKGQPMKPSQYRRLGNRETMPGLRGTDSTGESGKASPAIPPRPSSSRGASESPTGTSKSMTRPPLKDSAGRVTPARNSGAARIPRYQENLKRGEGRSSTETMEQEQALFEQRLCEDANGIAVRKINQYGKSSLRYVRCLAVDDDVATTKSTRSVGSRSAASRSRKSVARTNPSNIKRALVWGKKKDVQILVERFVAVRKGKTTERAKRNPAPATRIVSLLTDDPNHPSLDIEAPTRVDRDKFARAFARFLDIPLEQDDVGGGSVHSADALMASPADEGPRSIAASADSKNKHVVEGGFLNVQTSTRDNAESFQASFQSSQPSSSNNNLDSSKSSNIDAVGATVPVMEDVADDEASHVSSLTGHGYDQELVEELHNALTELRSELEESRAEAARAVKVAEQAIQSAEKSNSMEWQNTVTHKAAEAAAMAQKRSAEAMAQKRVAEEKLESERRNAAFWRKQAEISELEAGALQTRAAAAEIQRASMEERLESQRLVASNKFETVKALHHQSDSHHRDTLEKVLERNRAMEVEMERMRRELQSRKEQQENLENAGGVARNKRFSRHRSRSSDGPDSKMLSPQNVAPVGHPENGDVLAGEQVLKLQSEAAMIRQQFDLLKKTTVDELRQLPSESSLWSSQITQALSVSHTEVSRLREKLAAETASRRKLLHQVQDLQGAIRVYCRLEPAQKPALVSPASQTVLSLQPSLAQGEPMSYEFDKIFTPDEDQLDVYAEMEEVLLGALEGYKICVLGYGSTDSGKTETLLGKVEQTSNKIEICNPGLQFRAVEQLLAVAEGRSDRYNDVFTLTIVEVYNERIIDMLSGTPTGDSRGQVVSAESKPSRRKSVDDDASAAKHKLEIRTDALGDTVVQGSLSVNIKSFEDFQQCWVESLVARRQRLEEQGIEPQEYERASHVIATIRVVSSNVATGLATVGRVQFVDMAGADLIPRRSGSQPESASTGMIGWRFANKSLETFSEVVEARSQFVRSVPYRNSTLTHLLRDSLESDTKLLMIACVSSHPESIQEAAASLRFVARMRRVIIGKATRHTVTPP